MVDGEVELVAERTSDLLWSEINKIYRTTTPKDDYERGVLGSN